MRVVFDAVGYEYLGRMVYEKGWSEFFRTGPHREPLYAWLISVAMHLAEVFSWPYQQVLKFLQVGLLLGTQSLLLIVLRQLKIHHRIILAILLYGGFSPALVGATFSLFSEIVTMPFVLLSLICMIESWPVVWRRSARWVAMMAVLTTLAICLVALSKAIFIGVFLLYLALVFIAALIISLKEKENYWAHAVGYVGVSLVCLFGLIFMYGSLYKKYTGSFQYTDRYNYAILGSAYKRAQKVTPEIFWAHVASIPGKGVCRRFFSEEECVYCEAYSADHLGGVFLSQATAGVPMEQQDAKILEVAKGLIKANPGQYLMYMLYEAARMPFWESTQAGFVVYPPWLETLFAQGIVKDGIRLFISLLTIGALIFMLFHLAGHCLSLFHITEKPSPSQVSFFIIFVVLTYTSFFTFTFVLTRYAFPIAPLYLAMIACWLNTLLGLSPKEEVCGK